MLGFDARLLSVKSIKRKALMSGLYKRIPRHITVPPAPYLDSHCLLILCEGVVSTVQGCLDNNQHTLN